MHTSIRPARLLSGLTLLAVVAFGFAPPAAATSPAPAVEQKSATQATVTTPGNAPERSASDVAEAAAAKKAAETGADVIVEALTTPTEQVIASPDGKFTKTLSSEPVRMQYNGQWADISTDLVERDGVLKPKMVPAELSLGKGGSKHMSSVADGKGHSVSESWPYGPLPAAQVKGNTATYPGVLPGVDLIQVAKKQGVSQVLKIYTPEAARDPRVAELKLKLNSTGVELSSDGKGGLKGVSKTTGEDVLSSAAGHWWDSRYEGAGPTDPGGPGIMGSFELSLGTDAAGTHEKLAITAVTARNDLTYPLYIDPDWSTVRASFVYVDSAFPSTSYWNGQNTAEGNVHVGFLPAKWDYSLHVNHTTRGYWQFSTNPMVGKRIFAARFNVINIWSSTCAPRTVRAKITGGISPGTTWNAQPGIVRDIEAKSFAHGNEGAGCGDATVSFDMAAAKDIFPTVSQWTVGLFADNETDKLGWKRFRNDANIIISYGTPPNTPQITGMTNCSYQCPESGLQPGLTRFPKPVFTIYASDPDGNSDGSLAVWISVSRSSDSSPVWTAGAPMFVPGTGGSVNWGGTIPENAPLADGSYIIQAQISDSTNLVSTTVAYTFKIDTTPPPAPTVTSVSTALGDLYDENGTVGQTAYDFRLTVSDVDPIHAFIYSIDGEGVAPSFPDSFSCGQSIGTYTMVCPADGRSHTIRAAAISRLKTRITAWSVDQAGNIGTLKTTDQNGAPSFLEFGVGNYSPMPSQALEVTTSGSAGTVMVPAGWEGPSGSCTDIAEEGTPPEFAAAALDLQGGYGTTASPAADTANSFTVSGWFCPTGSLGAVKPVITQTDADGTVLIELRINAADKWELVTRTSAGGTESVVAAGSPVTTGTWYFVNAVYDKINRQLRITNSTSNMTGTWTVAAASDAHPTVPAGSKVVLGASSTTAGTERFTGLLAGPALTNGVLVEQQIMFLWASTDLTTTTVLK